MDIEIMLLLLAVQTGGTRGALHCENTPP